MGTEEVKFCCTAPAPLRSGGVGKYFESPTRLPSRGLDLPGEAAIPSGHERPRRTLYGDRNRDSINASPMASDREMDLQTLTLSLHTSVFLQREVGSFNNQQTK